MSIANLTADIENLFERALAQPPSRRAAFLDQECAGDPARRERIERLIRFAESDDGFLERSPLYLSSDERATATLYARGRLIGAYRLLRRIGAGGMADVWLAERTEGGFQQRAAVKIIRDAQGSLRERFATEREILASLTHPGIARLYDGGVEPDGCAYMIMEYVEGEHLGAYANARSLSLQDRLALFLQVCDAVAYAHTRLVVHRDIKPANILVSADGQVKLLDFGIAKLLDTEIAQDATRTLHLSPAYAAPEQLTGGYVSTATDVYALGVTLFELLTGRLPWSRDTTSLATALKRLLDDSIPPPSRTTGQDSPISMRALQGDLDAIIGRCLRKEPGHRYATVDALKLDVERHLRGEPVAARGGARLYVFGRFLRRYRWGVAGIAALILALAAGLGGVTWQARRAEAQAVRAETTKNFLIGVFKASNPTKASDTPRGGITARELLDASSTRIEKDFAGQPELQIELLGITAEIYKTLEVSERYASLHRKYMELARRQYGELHPLVIEGYLQDAIYASGHNDSENARHLLDQVDPLIRQAGLDEKPVRARWWVTKVKLLTSSPTREAEARALLTRAIDLYERTDPREEEYVDALIFLGNNYANADGDRARARDFHLRAKAALALLPEDDAEAAFVESVLARDATQLGDLAEAAAGYERAAKLFLKTLGEPAYQYWQVLAHWAKVICDNGERERAHQLFGRLLALLPEEPSQDQSVFVALAQKNYGYCLAEEGRPQEAIPPLETADRLQVFQKKKEHALVNETWRILGDAYARVGRNGDARRVLTASVDGSIAQGSAEEKPNDPKVLNARESWGRFLLTQGETAESETQFREILAQDHGRNLAVTALAHAGLARLALQRGDAKAALEASTQALRVFSSVSGYRTVRIEPYLWRVHAQALARTGDIAAAQDYAGRSLTVFTRYDDPASANIAESAAVVAEIGKLAKK